MPDILPPASDSFSLMESVAKNIFELYGYKEIRLPLMEKTELFQRGIGGETDIVQKEMYTFPDRKGRSLTLRPEATAGMVRAYIENSLWSEEGQLVKLYSYGPMFRYERPQKGRYRQFQQIDVEAFGSSAPAVDAEMILMAGHFFWALGLKNLSIQLNNLGCHACRPLYIDALHEFFRGMHKAQLCEVCLQRKLANPLRLLDCKVPSCQEVAQYAPNIIDFICPYCQEHFAEVRRILDLAEVPYEINPRLVRGLDYYVRTTFEVISGEIGAQSAVAGGGRYDGLIASLGGPDHPGIGFAAGMERLALLLGSYAAPAPDFYIASLDSDTIAESVLLAEKLRRRGLTGEISTQAKSLKSQMRHANKINAGAVVLLGAEEKATGVVQIKNMRTSLQEAIPINLLAEYLLNAKYQDEDSPEEENARED